MAFFSITSEMQSRADCIVAWRCQIKQDCEYGYRLDSGGIIWYGGLKPLASQNQMA